MANRAKHTAGVWVTLLLGLPFLGVGIGAGYFVASTLIDAQRMKSWTEVPASIIRTELTSSQGDDSTTYRVTAEYSYYINNKSYHGSRVGLHGGYDNIGSFHHRVNAELNQYVQSEKPFRCYVNPENPNDSILYPNPRWEKVGFMMLFCLLFGGAGLGITIFGVSYWLKNRRSNIQKTIHPDKPWTWNQEWANGVVKSSNRNEMRGSLVFTAFWNLISIPAAILAVNDMVSHKTGPMALLVLIFPAIGLLLIVWTFRSMARWHKFGESQFAMASVPGVIGGSLGGVIRVPVHIQPEDGFSVTITCTNRVTTGSGKNSSTHNHVLWQDARLMKRALFERDHARSAIPVLFGIPYSCRATDETDTSNEVIWKLEVKAAVPGIDYSATFDVPVFMTDKSSPDFKLDDSAIAPYEAKMDPAAILKGSGIQVTPLANGAQQIYFAPARNAWHAAGMTIFCAVWTCIVYIMATKHAPLAMTIIFGLVDVFVFYGVLRMWLASWLVRADRTGLDISSRLMGIGWSRRIERSEIAEVKAVPGMQSGNTQFLDIKAELRNGRSCMVGARVAGQMEAKAVLSAINNALSGSTAP
jgi:hypothetical protein